jgi:hypothetical protein
MKLIEKTIGAFRHLMEKHRDKGFPVGFSIVMYDPKADEKWYYDMRVIMDPNSVDIHDAKLRERIALVNEFLAEGIKRILHGELDEMLVQEWDDKVFQIPGMKGRG